MVFNHWHATFLARPSPLMPGGLYVLPMFFFLYYYYYFFVIKLDYAKTTTTVAFYPSVSKVLWKAAAFTLLAL